MLDLLLTPLSAMSISPVRNSMNSSRAASSPSDLDARKVSWVAVSGKRCFLELNGQLCCSSRSTTLKTSLVNQPVFSRIAHARAERGEGREGKNGLAKLARFLKPRTECSPDHKIGNYCYWARKLGWR